MAEAADPETVSETVDTTPEEPAAAPAIKDVTHPFRPLYDHRHAHKRDDQIHGMASGHFGAGRRREGANVTNKLIVKKAFTVKKGNEFPVTLTAGKAFGNGMKIQVKEQNLYLVDGENEELVAFTERDEYEQDGVMTVSFDIFCSSPLFEGQEAAERDNFPNPVYPYASVEPGRYSSEKFTAKLANEMEPSFAAHHAGGTRIDRKTVVTRLGSPASLIEDGGWEGYPGCFLVTVNKGIDPCLMIFLAAISTEYQQKKKKRFFFF